VHTVAPPRLMLVTDRRLCPLDRLPALAAQVVGHGVDAVQLREKDLPPDELLALARALRVAIGDRALLFVNGDVDVALAAGADGVQLGEAAMAVAAARRRAGGRLLIGRSVHDVAGAVAAAQEGADLLIAGTVYPSRSHPGGDTGGPDLIRRIVAAVHVPVLGIGGITQENATAVIAAGAAGVAVISAILAAPDPARAAAKLRAAVEAAAAVGQQT
jgi:thiamine-phosphate diphosphorylase